MPEDVIASVELGGEEVIRRLAPRWERLCEEAGSAPFCRPEWIATYIRAFEPRSQVVVVSASIGDRLVAVLPMVRKRCFYAGVPLVKLAGTANSHSIQFDILRSRDGLGDAAVRAMWNLLRRTPGWQVLELPLFPLDGTCAQLLAHAAQDGYPTLKLLAQNSPVLRLQVNGNGVPAPVGSRHFRHELRRFARVLAQETGTEPKVIRREDPDPHLLREFFDLEQAGWKGRKGSAIGCRPETLEFYQRIAQEGSERGYFRMHSLDANGKMVAGAFSVVTSDGFFPMKVAHDENLRRGGPGHVLFNAIVTECSENRVSEVFFGGTDEHYKSLWTQDTVALYTACVFASDLRSLLAYRLRNNVLSPLGRLRWQVRQRLEQRKRNAAKRASGNEQKKAKPGNLVKVTEPSKNSPPRPTVHSS